MSGTNRTLFERCPQHLASHFGGVALTFALLGLVASQASALVPSEQAAFEIPLPFQEGYLVYGDAVGTVDVPPIAPAIGAGIGGQWSVHSWNRRAESPHYILGSGADVAPALGTKADAEAAAHHLFVQLELALGAPLDQMRVERVAQGANKFAVHYQQTYEGIDVLGGRAHATFMQTGRVFAMGVDLYPIDGLSVLPRLSLAEAERIAIDALPHDERVISTETDEKTGLYVLPYPTAVDRFDARLVWRVVVVTDGRTGVFHCHVDTHTGEILWRFNSVHYTRFFGITDADVEQTTSCNGQSYQRMKYMEVEVIGLGTTVSDDLGQWEKSNGDNNPRLVQTQFSGPFVDVDRASGGPDAVLLELAQPGILKQLHWDDTNSRRDERDVLDAVVDAHDFFDALDPDFAFPSTQVTANVGVAGVCNAFWNGTSINFYDAGGGCANSGEIQGIVHHEYGHGVQDHLVGGTETEGIHEGNADILANFMTDEAIIGRGFLMNCSNGLRTSNNSFQYPEDLTGQVHNDGRILAGVMWDARQNLELTLGAAAGKQQAALVWHYGRKLELPINQPDQCISMLVADDDNGDLGDGTPNYDALCAAILRHDADGDAFDCPGSIWVDFAHVGTESGTRENPYNALFQAQTAASNGYHMIIKAGTSNEVGTLQKAGRIRSTGGTARIGAP